jgi:hypothetical protein
MASWWGLGGLGTCLYPFGPSLGYGGISASVLLVANVANRFEEGDAILGGTGICA